ncbi:MAG: hypothetical protein ACYCX8_08615, partial [Acidimicrobiales bacterium]
PVPSRLRGTMAAAKGAPVGRRAVIGILGDGQALGSMVGGKISRAWAAQPGRPGWWDPTNDER